MNLTELLKQLAAQPLMLIGILLVVGSLASTTEIAGISVDPDKWGAGLATGFILIGISMWRNRKK